MSDNPARCDNAMRLATAIGVRPQLRSSKADKYARGLLSMLFHRSGDSGHFDASFLFLCM